MLSDLLSENLIQLDVDAADWKDAIYKATAPMVESGVVTEGYVEDIIKGKEELGPYFVLTEHVARFSPSSSFWPTPTSSVSLMPPTRLRML